MDSSVSIKPNNTSVFTNKNEESNDLINQLPDEIIFQIFSYLSAVELVKSCWVCQNWRRVGSDSKLWLLQLSKEVNIIGHEHPDSLKEVTDKRKILSILKQARVLKKAVVNNAGVTLMPILKGFSPDNLIQNAQEKRENIVRRFRIVNNLLKSFENLEVDETYWILITNDVWESTKGLTFSDKEEQLKKYGYRRPRVVEMVALLSTTLLDTQKRLYSNSYTYCEEYIADDHPVYVGNFDSFFGFNISYSLVTTPFIQDGNDTAVVWEVR